MKLMHKLLLLSVLPFLFIILSIIFVSKYQSESILRQQISEIANLELNLHSERIAAFFLKKVDELKFMGSTPVVQRGNIPEILSYFEGEQKRLSRYIEGIYYNDLEGTVYDVAGVTFSVRDRYYFPQIARGEVVITKVIKSRATQKPIVLILVPIFDTDGNRTGAVGGTILVKDLLQMIMDIKVGQSGFAIMVDEDDRVVSSFGKQRRPGKDIFLKSLDTTDSTEGLRNLIKTIRDLKHNTTRVVYDKSSYQVFFKPIKTIRWSLLLMYKESEVLAALKQMNTLYALMCLCGGIAICLFTYGIKQIVLDPIQTLVRVQQQFGEGDLFTRFKNTSQDEFGALSLSFNNMADQLTERTTRIEKEVVERKRTEEALRESEGFLRTIVENIPDMIFVKDAKELRFVRFNKAGEELLGYSREELIGKNDYDIFPKEVADFFTENDRDVLSSGEHLDIPEEPIQTKYKGERILHTKKMSILDEEGKPRYLLGISEDITERKRTEEALKESEERYRSLVENIDFGVTMIDSDHNIVMTNVSQAGMFNKPVHEFIGKKCFREYEKRENVCPHCPGVQAMSTGHTAHTETEGIRDDGSRFSVSINAFPILSEDGHPTGFIEVVEDITERKHVREVKEKLEAQLQQAQKMEAIGTLAGGIAHDFNNILSSVIGYTELAMDDVERKYLLHSHLQEVLNAGIRAKDLVKQILTFSRQTEQETKPIQIKPIVKEVLKLIRASLPTTIEIKQNLQSDATVLADPTQIHQVLMNLCTNAGHAMCEKGGLLDVSLVNVALDSDYTDQHLDLKYGPYLKLTVSDTGHGMPSNVLNQIFDPFFTTKDKGEGTGMGLSVVHGIVKSYDGKITAYSDPGKGSVFNVFLPTIEKPIGQNKRMETPVPKGKERILFIDDELALIDMGRKLIESLGYDVVTRTSSIEALELFHARSDNFDLVITDMTMPKMTGDKLAEELLRIKPDIPIILCTGFSAMMDENKTKAMGIRAFVSKPVLKREIAETIREVLDQKMDIRL